MAILNMQLRRLAALERQKILDDHDELQSQIDDFRDILAKPQRQRDIVSSELAEIVEKYGDERRTSIERVEGDMSIEDLIPDEDVVVTITRGGYAKRTRVDHTGRSVAAARASRRPAARRGRRRALLHDDHPPLAAVLHQPGPGLPAPRRTSCPSSCATPRASTWRTCWRSSRARRSRRSWRSRTTRRRPTWCWPRGAGW